MGIDPAFVAEEIPNECDGRLAIVDGSELFFSASSMRTGPAHNMPIHQYLALWKGSPI
jgi:hypothetical protein